MKKLNYQMLRKPQHFPFTPRLGIVISFIYRDKNKVNNKMPENLNPLLLVGGFSGGTIGNIIQGTNLRYFQLFPQQHAALSKLLEYVVSIDNYDRSSDTLKDERMFKKTGVFHYDNLNDYVIDFKPKGQPEKPVNAMKYFWGAYDSQKIRDVQLININNIMNEITSGRGIFK